MHLKVVKAGNYEYVRLVEAYRENGKVKHKVILNLGRKDLIEGNPSFKRLAERLAELVTGSSVLNRTKEAEASEGTLRHYGFVIYRKLWQLFELDKLLSALTKNNARLKLDLNSVCFLMVVQHLLSPRSKLATYLNREQYLGIPEIDLNHLYRSLDLLAENKEHIEDYIFSKNRSLFNLTVDVVFYDVTTFHFESVRNDGFRDFGFSKANKINEVQIVMGLLVDSEGRPIGYELFPGNTLDSKTLEKSLEKLKKRFCIRQVVIVADRGLNSKLNLKRIKDQGYDYIVATRLKKMSESILAEVFNPEGYVSLEMPSPASEKQSQETSDQFRYKILDRINRFKDEDGVVHELPEKLIITYSSKRAAKDEQDRKRLVEKAEKLLDNPGRIKASNKRGGKKFIQHKSENDQFFLDEEAIANDDGYYAIQSSRFDLDAKSVLEAYHTLWKIEESFRIMKSTLEVRPIFHWTEKRIQGHFIICFLAFLLERTLEFRLKENQVEVSPVQIQEAINTLSFTEVEMNGQKFLIKMRPNDNANKMLRILRIAPPKNMLPLEDANEFTW